MTVKKSVRLQVDACRAIDMHLAANPHLKTQTKAMNDMIIQFGSISQLTKDNVTNTSYSEIMEYLKEQSNSVQQLITLALRNYGLNIETAANFDAELPNKGEQRARSLLKQMNKE